jgi:hypothetical protein
MMVFFSSSFFKGAVYEILSKKRKRKTSAKFVDLLQVSSEL